MNELIAGWKPVFEALGCSGINYDGVLVPKREGRQNLPIFVPQEVSPKEVLSLFARMAEARLGCVVFAHSVEEMTHVRTTAGGSYVHWVMAGAYEWQGVLYDTYHPYQGMTLIERLLHELWMTHYYGDEYWNLHTGGYTHYCHGTTRGKTLCDLEYDPQDVKFVTRFFWRHL
jgi:hypothetical protein